MNKHTHPHTHKYKFDNFLKDFGGVVAIQDTTKKFATVRPYLWPIAYTVHFKEFSNFQIKRTLDATHVTFELKKENSGAWLAHNISAFSYSFIVF